MSGRTAGIVVLLLVGGLVVWNATWGGGGPDSTRPPTGSPVRWYDDWARAAADARARDQLVLVYVALDSRTCPPCARLEREVFERSDAGRLAEHCIPFKADLAGPSGTDAYALVESLRVGAAPALVLLDPERHVLHRQIAGLMVTYDRNARPMPGEADSLLELDSLIGVVDVVTARARREAEEMAVLRASDEPAARLRLARMYRDREQYALALELFSHESLAGHLVAREARAETLAEIGRHEDAAAAFRALLAEHPDDGRALAWRLAAVTAGLQDEDADADDLETAERLLLEIATESARHGEFDVEDRARIELARLHLRRDERIAAAAVLDWFERRREANPMPPDDRWALAEIASRVGRHDLARRHLERLARDHPDSMLAQRLKHGMLDSMRR